MMPVDNIDAIHMQALVADPADRLALNERALEIASLAQDPAARDWDALAAEQHRHGPRGRR